MILAIKKTENGTEWKVSNRYDKLNRWSGTVKLSLDEKNISCKCMQAEKYLSCTHQDQVREYLERNNHEIVEFDKEEEYGR